MAQSSLRRETGFALPGIFTSFAGWLRDTVAGSPYSTQQPETSAYLTRKRTLPNTFTNKDWQRALEYWDHRCAVCERPRGLWHTLAQDHWVPLTNKECPGTTPTNILPLCHGTDGCNNSKGKRRPETWLYQKLGKRRAEQKLADIRRYFEWVEDQASPRLGCPYCGGRVRYNDQWHIWECIACEGFWGHKEARKYENCPKCQCWMLNNDGSHICPRCNLAWDHTNLPTHEKCPHCERGHLKWVYRMGETAGWWKCNRCQGEWLFE